MSKKFTEIFNLKEMLDAIGLEYEFSDRSVYLHEYYQICLYDEYGERIVSVVQGACTYGSEQDKLEIMGLLTPEEEEQDTVIGWLSAEEVYERIMNYYGSREKL